MIFIKVHSTKAGMVINIVTGSISLKYHVLFYDTFSTVVSSTAADQ